MSVIRERRGFNAECAEAERSSRRGEAGAKEEPGEKVAEEDEGEGESGEFEFVGEEPSGGRGAVADGEKTFREVAESTGEKQSQDEGAQRDLEDSGGEDEDFEGHGRREDGGNRRGEEPVALDPLAGLSGTGAGALAEPYFPSLPRNVIEDHAAGDGARRGHQCVPGHARGRLDGKVDDEQVVEDGEREDGGVEKSDQENAQAAEGGDGAGEPVGELVGDGGREHGSRDSSRVG